MSNRKNVNARGEVESNHITLTVIVGAICGAVFFLLAYKLAAALVFLLRWFGSYELMRFDILQGIRVSSFAIAWGFWSVKSPTPRKAMVWQTTLSFIEWVLLCGIAIVINRNSGSLELSYFTHTFVFTILAGTLSGFVTAWVLPHVLDWLKRSVRRTSPPSSSNSQKDAVYEIRG